MSSALKKRPEESPIKVGSTYETKMPFRKELAALIKLAGPIILSQIGFVMMGVVDTVVVGRYSAEALAAVAAGNVYHWSFLVVGMGILFALDPLISQAHGAGDLRSIRAWIHRALVIATVLSVILFVVFQFADPVLLWFEQPATIVPKASDFIRANAPGVWACFVFTVFRQALQATGITSPALVAIIVGNIGNLAFNYVLVFGKFGFPELGATGSGIATSLSRFLMVAIILYAGRKTLFPLFSQGFQLGKFRDHLSFLKIGVPIGIQMGLETWAYMAVSLLMGQIGVTALAGHQIAVQLSSLFFMIPFGLGSAVSIRVGQAIGRKDCQSVRSAAVAAMGFGAGVMGFISLMLALFPIPVAKAFTSDADVLEMTIRFLPIVALFQIFDGLQGIASGALRGTSDTRLPAVIVFIGFWVLAIPLGYVLAFKLHYGPSGLWLGLAGGLVVTVLLMVSRLIFHLRKPSALNIP